MNLISHGSSLQLIVDPIRRRRFDKIDLFLENWIGEGKEVADEADKYFG